MCEYIHIHFIYTYIPHIHICVCACICVCDFIIDHLVYNHSLQCIANNPIVAGSRINTEKASGHMHE